MIYVDAMAKETIGIYKLSDNISVCYDYIYRGIEHYPSNGNNSFNDKCNF